MNLLLVGSSGLVGREILEAFRKVDYSYPTNSFAPIDTFIAMTALAKGCPMAAAATGTN